ncbi:MAG: AMP-binding enzyme, partial [Terriglobia bacterium]
DHLLDWEFAERNFERASDGLGDVIYVSGHRLDTAEIERALVAHPAVAEAAVVGYPHPIKGQGVYAYITLRSDARPSDELRRELGQRVRSEIGPIAAPDFIQWAPTLPKTRVGMSVRHILRKIAANDGSDLGDISMLADPAVIDELISSRPDVARTAE